MTHPSFDQVKKAHVVRALKEYDRLGAQSFFATHPVENTERTLKEAYEASTDCIHLRETQEPKLKAWLDALP